MIKFDDLTDPAKIEAWILQVYAWLDANVLVLSTVIQALIVFAAFIVAWATAAKARALLEKGWNVPWYRKYGKPVADALAPLSLPVVWLVLQWFSVFAAAEAAWPHHLIKVVVSLLTAWVVIRLAATLIRDPQWSRAVTIAAWVIAALNITGLLAPTSAVLDSMAMQIGEVRISILSVIKAGIALAVLLWLAGFSARLLERRLAVMPAVSPSAQVLFGKLFRVLVFTIAVVIGLESVGIDLTAFAVFSGAVGLGVGFGLQKVISNLISGMILLMDKSVKPGDVIALGQTYGEIKTLNARYVSVITRDGTEHLIPNEELISQRVENWSFSHRLVRLRLPIGISYESDVERALDLAIEAASATTRVLDNPKPVCNLTGFGASSVDLELRAWVGDPQNGLGSVRSAILLKVWHLYRKNAIAFPYPQQDIHLKSVPPELLGDVVAEQPETLDDSGAEEGAVARVTARSAAGSGGGE